MVKNLTVVPTHDGVTDKLLTLFWTTVDDPGGSNEDYKLHSLISTDQDGDDFGLQCPDNTACSSTTGCSVHTADTAAWCDFEDTGIDLREEYHAEDGNCLAAIGWHGHALWDDLGASWDPDEDELSLLFTGDNVGAAPCHVCGDIDADVNMWRWDTGGGCDAADPDPDAKFCLEEELRKAGGDTAYCPDDKWEDVHDPAMVAYPGEFKVYAKTVQKRWYVGYSSDNGRSYEDTSVVQFLFEDETPTDTGDTDDELDGGCVGDPAVLIWKGGALKKEMMVFLAVQVDPENPDLYTRDRCFETQDTLIEPDDTAYRAYPGAIAAVLENG